MIVHKRTKDRVTISFSSVIGKEGLKRVKNFVEFIEAAIKHKKRKISHGTINRLADEVSKLAWKKFIKARGISA